MPVLSGMLVLPPTAALPHEQIDRDREHDDDSDHDTVVQGRSLASQS
jgi:hypothetical protein